MKLQLIGSLTPVNEQGESGNGGVVEFLVIPFFFSPCTSVGSFVANFKLLCGTCVSQLKLVRDACGAMHEDMLELRMLCRCNDPNLVPL